MSAGLPAWQRIQVPMEKTKIVIFSVQEIVITCFYVHAAYSYLQGRFMTKNKARNAMLLLLMVQLVIIAVDIAIVGLDFLGHTKLKVIVHSFVYSIKLELEFVILNQLIEMSRTGLAGMPVLDQTVGDAYGKVTMVIKAGEPNQWKMTDSSTTSEVDGDLETANSIRATCALDFITVPQHISLE
jgi:hypothetical protein